MKINLKRVLSILLVLCLCMGTLPTVALAAETKTETVVNEDGTTTTTETTTNDPETDEATGNVTITVIVKETITDADNTVTGTKTTETVTVTDADGNVISTKETGSEITSEIKEPAPGEKLPEVTVELEPGQTTTGKVETTVTTGDSDKTDGEWDYTKTTTTERTVEAEASEITVTENDPSTGAIGEEVTVVDSRVPVYDEENGTREDKKDVFDEKFNLFNNASLQDPSTWAEPEDGEFRYVGFGEEGKFWSAHVYVTYKKNPDGSVYLDENNQPVIESITNKQGKPFQINGENVTALPEDPSLESGTYNSYASSRPKIFMMLDKTAIRFTAIAVIVRSPRSPAHGTTCPIWRTAITTALRSRRITSAPS